MPMIASLFAGCTARFEVEPARVWTGFRRAGFGDGTLDVVAGPADAPTVLARQYCEAQSEQPARSDCAGEGGLVVLSFDDPSGVAADVAATQFEERSWVYPQWVGDVDGTAGQDLASNSDGDFLLFDGASLPEHPDTADALTLLPPGTDLAPLGACGDVDGDGHADLCLEDVDRDGVAVLFGPLDHPVDEPPVASLPRAGPAVFPGDLDGDGDDEFLVDPLEAGPFAWSAGVVVALDEGDVLVDCLGPDAPFYLGFSAGDADGDGVPDLFDGIHLLHGPSLMAPGAAGCDALVSTTYDSGNRTVVGGATGDLDGDGVSDLVLLVRDPDTGEGELEIHRGPIPAGTFSSAHAELVLPYGEVFSAFRAVQVADIDGDGRDDLVVAAEAGRYGPRSANAVFVWRGPDLLPPR